MLGMEMVTGFNVAGDDRFAHEVEQEIGIVCREIKNYADIVDTVREGSHAANRDLENTPGLALVQPGFECHDRWIEALDMTGPQLQAVPMGKGDELFSFGRGSRDRLFDENMDSSLEGLTGESVVGRRRSRDRYDIEARLLEQTGKIAIERRAITRREISERFLPGVG